MVLSSRTAKNSCRRAGRKSDEPGHSGRDRDLTLLKDVQRDSKSIEDRNQKRKWLAAEMVRHESFIVFHEPPGSYQKLVNIAQDGTE